MLRKAMKDTTLRDGTFVPRGTFVGAPFVTMHFDDALYARADAFDPFRFARMRASGEGEGTKYQMVHTSAEYMPFGHGRHAW